MPRRDRDVFHPGRLGERHPGARVELHGIERRGDPLVIGDRDRTVLHHPLALAEQAVDAPVDEHPELGVAIPFARREPLDGGGTESRLWASARRTTRTWRIASN